MQPKKELHGPKAAQGLGTGAAKRSPHSTTGQRRSDLEGDSALRPAAKRKPVGRSGG